MLAVERYNALLKPLRTGLRLNKDNIKKAIAFQFLFDCSLCLIHLFTLFEVPTLERDSDAEQVVGSQHHRMTTFSDSDPFLFSSPNVKSKKS